MWKMNYNIPSGLPANQLNTTTHPASPNFNNTHNKASVNPASVKPATRFFTRENMFTRIVGDPCFSCGK